MLGYVMINIRAQNKTVMNVLVVKQPHNPPLEL